MSHEDHLMPPIASRPCWRFFDASIADTFCMDQKLSAANAMSAVMCSELSRPLGLRWVCAAASLREVWLSM